MTMMKISMKKVRILNSDFFLKKSLDFYKKIIIYFFTNKRIININQFRYGKD